MLAPHLYPTYQNFCAQSSRQPQTFVEYVATDSRWEEFFAAFSRIYFKRCENMAQTSNNPHHIQTPGFSCTKWRRISSINRERKVLPDSIDPLSSGIENITASDPNVTRYIPCNQAAIPLKIRFQHPTQCRVAINRYYRPTKCGFWMHRTTINAQEKLKNLWRLL